MGEKIRRISLSQLPPLLRTTPARYHALSSPQVVLISGSSTQNLVTQNLCQTSTPTPPSQNSPSYSTSPIVSTPGGHSPTQLASPTKGTIFSMGQNLPTQLLALNTPPPNTSIVVPFFKPGRTFMIPTRH